MLEVSAALLWEAGLACRAGLLLLASVPAAAAVEVGPASGTALPPGGGGYVGMVKPGGGLDCCELPPGTKEAAAGLKEKLEALGLSPLPLFWPRCKSV